MIRDTVAAVFQDPAFNRTSLLQRFGAWLLEVVEAILARLQPGRMPVPVFWAVVILVIVILVALLARAARAMWLEHRTSRASRQRTEPGRAGVAVDAWNLAARLAAMGDHTAAAHALYAGLLAAIARRGEIELDASKTIGDYVRDLARRSSSVLSRFVEFARSYEATIYGEGHCDRDRYERLLGMANGIVGSRA